MVASPGEAGRGLLSARPAQPPAASCFDRSRAAFAAQVAGIKAKLLASTVICSDETTMRVRTQTWWQWTFQNDQACVHIIRPSRGKAVPR